MINQNIVQKLKELSNQHRTPFYCYFEKIILANISKLKRVLPPHSQIFYSLKANSHPLVVSTILKNKLFCDVASIGEMQIAIEAGADAKSISFTGPGKSREDIDKILNLNIGFINVESKDELDYINLKNPKVSKVLLRVAWPTINNQFGIEISEIKDILKDAKYSNIIIGIHTHFKSQILDSDKLLSHIEKSVALAIDLKENHNLNLKMINIGSGFGIPYFSEDKELDLNLLQLKINNYFESDTIMHHLSNVKIAFESGRFLVGNAGFYVAKVEYIKKIKQSVFAIINGGFYQFMAAASIGQILKRPFLIHTFSTDQNLEKITIAGNSCSELDIFAENILLPKLNVCDSIYIENAGAYGIGYSPINFIKHELPPQFFIEN